VFDSTYIYAQLPLPLDNIPVFSASVYTSDIIAASAMIIAAGLAI
jgi:hypothetical protein